MLFKATPPFVVEAAIAQPSVQALQAMNYLAAADMAAEDGDCGANA